LLAWGETLLPGQAEHVAAPVLLLKKFAAHGLHVAPFAPVYPVLHRHSVLALLPVAELEFNGQSEHVSIDMAPAVLENLPATQSVHPPPTADLCLPAAHAAHAPPSGPEKPALHWHRVRALLPAGDVELVGQF
jgi:hypothetical protein